MLKPGQRTQLLVDVDEQLGAWTYIAGVQDPRVRPEQFQVYACQ